MTTQYIICAAVWIQDNIIHQHQPKNIETGFVVCGRRHHNCFITMHELGYQRAGHVVVQGFITSDDRFVERKDAAKIAFDSGQIAKISDCLFSEDLY